MAKQGPRKPFRLARDFYRRKPVTAWGGTAVLAGLAVAVVAIVLVGGGSEPANVAINCSVYESESGIRVSFKGMTTKKEAEEGCTGLAQEWSSAATYWKAGTPPLPDAEPKFDCAFEPPPDKKQSGVIFVEANPEASIIDRGRRLCGLLAHSGWIEASAPTGGPWIHEWRAEQARISAREEQERQQREEEAAVEEEHREAIFACEERAEAKELREAEAIERETEERIEAAPESEEYEIWEEGYEREEEALEREEASREECAVEAAPNKSLVEPEGEIEYR